ncbi:hypothetical protein [Gemmata massiliana]|uniref:hypothetical protein n=1 Tax=Gemmata massiliana TaxID=1210884 RepID=UPI0013A6C637|nr:hypothetical protein [Gemmata massiliana]
MSEERAKEQKSIEDQRKAAIIDLSRDGRLNPPDAYSDRATIKTRPILESVWTVR